MKAFDQSSTVVHGLPVAIEADYRKHKAVGFSGLYHYHDYYELIYCISGEFKVQTYAESYKLSTGDLIFINTNMPHGIDFITPDSEQYYIKFSQSVLFPYGDTSVYRAHFLALLATFKNLEYVSASQIEGTDVGAVFKKTVDNYKSEEYGYEFIMRAGVLEIMTYVFRSCRSDNNSTAVVTDADFPTKEVEKYINDNFQTVTLTEIAKHFSFSYSYFSKKFLTAFGIPFKNYLTKIRVNESMKLLSDSKLSIAEIAVTVGFSSSSHFIESFRKQKAMTPAKFRHNTKQS
mgnify:CR=1 FL=1